MIEQLVEQGLTFGPEVVLNEKVESITRNEAGIFELHAASGKIHFSKTVIVAVGGGILKPQKLEIEGAERFEVGNLHYTVKSLKQFKDKTIVISGGVNSAAIGPTNWSLSPKRYMSLIERKHCPGMKRKSCS